MLATVNPRKNQRCKNDGSGYGYYYHQQSRVLYLFDNENNRELYITPSGNSEALHDELESKCIEDASEIVWELMYK